MKAEELVNLLESNEVILPKDLLESSSQKELVSNVIYIYETHKDKITHERNFYDNYLSLVNYLYIEYVSDKKEKKREPIFDSSLIDSLLSLPEPA